MWKLNMRGDRGTPFVALRSYPNISDAARVIREKEGDPFGALFLHVYVDPSPEPSDADILSRLEYQSAKPFYLLTRSAH